MSDRPLPLRSPSSPPPISIGRFPRLCSILVKSMARFRNSLIKWRTPVLIWTSSLVFFYFTFQIAMDHSAPSLDPGSTMSSSEQRAKLYDKMARDLDEKGPAFLKGGETSQSLSLSDLFEVKDGSVTPRLKAADPPVRANVLYLSPEFSIPISRAVKEIFLPYFDGVIWFQNTSVYHLSMFHASHHLTPVIATDNEIEAEANSVKAVASHLCPLKIVLDRVVLTSTGVLLGCWQVTSGTDPVMIRAKLKNALPGAPEKQLYDPVMLHASFARLLGHPKVPAKVMKKPFDQLQFFHELVAQVNHKLHGFEATVSEIWYVEEYDVLALALNGRMKVQKFRLGCSQS